MNPSNRDGWPPQPSSGQPGHLPMNDPGQSQQHRPFGGFGQPSGQSLPALAGLSQSSPMQPMQNPPPSHAQQQQPQQLIGPNHPSQAHQGPGYPLPGLGHTAPHQPQPPPLNLELERELRERDMREREIRERQRQHDDAAQRERELRDREQRERMQREQSQAQHSNTNGSVPMYQPVATRVPATIHGPNGLLANHAAVVSPNTPNSSLSAPNGPNAIFGNGPSATDGVSRPIPQQNGTSAAQQQQQQMLGFVAPSIAHQLPGAVAGVPQGQQPILNDALSYLDQVKVQFVEQEGVYNRFLDIMKDFKSQTIDTPGVIERVVTLFAGHPNLIQGFNTFLPPGYSIECGSGDDANIIRVMTPMGSVLQMMPAPYQPPELSNGTNGVNGAGAAGRQDYDQSARIGSSLWRQQAELGANRPEMVSPSGRVLAHPAMGQQPANPATQNGQADSLVHQGQSQRDQQVAAANAAAIAHQQEQRGVSHLSNAVSAATNGDQSGRQAAIQTSPLDEQATALNPVTAAINGVGGAVQAPGTEKRGPVEFNHAISYVNKIKNRFASEPDIYKSFLEILQTYQRESKPIQDVYAQVTHLFNSAPDLLEDFKQFLPESAAQAKAQAAARQAAEDAAILSHVRGDAYPSGAQNAQAQATSSGHRSEMKLPPVGNFVVPPSASKEGKKRRGGALTQGTLNGGSGQASSSILDTGGSASGAGTRASVVPAGNASKQSFGMTQQGQKRKQPEDANNLFFKRAKITHTKPTAQSEMPPSTASPTLTPALPQPLPPTSSERTDNDELAFFDRAKKFISNKQTFNEFLKLCNLFTQDLINKNVLVHKASSFIGGSADLMTWFKNFVGYEGKDEVIENNAKVLSGRVTLSNCRGLGPSYRLLPKRERMKVCSGRDEMCHQVLNDEWASHPTWASEDSGFQAHRKNMFEEGLHRIEEERHDYDFNIEATLRTIQLLEPIAQQISLMNDEERKAFKLSPGIGGQSETIYKRVIKKIYDRERGQRVIDDLFEHPCAVVPVILFRMKQKAEEWKGSQREWEKVWREQTQKMFFKSLDHQGLSAKQHDRKQFMSKTLMVEIQTKYEEQKRQRIVRWNVVPKYQFQYSFDDIDVIHDACHLLLTFIELSTSNVLERQKLEIFFKEFVPLFFGLDSDKFVRQMKDIYEPSTVEEEVENESPAPEEVSTTRGRRAANGKKPDLLRGVLERGRTGKASRKDSAMRESKETSPSPDVGMPTDDDVGGPAESGAENATDLVADKWINHPSMGSIRNRTNQPNIQPNEPYKRDTYHMYCNLNVYCFFRMFEILYERLRYIKENEKQVHEDVSRAKAPKPALELRLIDKTPQDFFSDTSANANYYYQILGMCEDVVKGELDMGQLEDTLRRFYMANGWQLYGFDKMLAAVVRFATLILVSDAKDNKSNDIVQLFLKDREKEETTHANELAYRKQVEKLTKEGDIYRITFHQPTMKAMLQIFKRDNPTFENDDLTDEAKWSYYISSYCMVEPTEGVPLSRCRVPFLKRNLPKKSSTEDEDTQGSILDSTISRENLVVRISVNSYKILYDQDTEDFFAKKEWPSIESEEVKQSKEKRRNMFVEKFVTNPKWITEMGAADVEALVVNYRKLVQGKGGEKAEKVDAEDEDMADTI
ncbi:MAG: Transcriptional regulatory protein sin3 [Candelina mexicana]|nr:MAG: Transcriptional regulatory protein sin3 [Candelina mexicana]